MVLSAFEPVDNIDKLQVNHKNFVKTDNYVNKIYHDESYDPSNNPAPTIRMKKNVFSDETILRIRNLSEQGIKNTEIKSKYYPNIPLELSQI